VTPPARARRDATRPTPDAGRRDPAPRAAAGAAAIDYGRLAPSMAQIRIPALHDSGYVGTGVLVAVLDAGFNEHDTHEALRDRPIAPGHRRDFVEGDTTVTDPDTIFGLQHGTWVLGVLTGNAPGEYVGAAPGIDLALARTEYDFAETPAEEEQWARAAEWADSLGADLIQSSLGYFEFDEGFPDYTYADMDGATTIVSRAARIAASRGILVVNSAGNTGNAPWHYVVAPADVNGDSLIAVGAVDLAGNPAASSAYGPTADGRVKPDLAAHGVSVPIVSTGGDPEGYSASSGTSLSAPLVSGLAACLMQARPEWTPVEVIRALRETASRFRAPDHRVGYGIPNGARALRWPEPIPDVPLRGRLGITLASANPFHPADGELRVAFASADAAPARITVRDVGGRLVRSLWTGALDAGRPREAFWDGRDDEGRAARPGLYWVALESRGDLATRRVTLLR
jgi:serine protease AprX